MCRSRTLAHSPDRPHVFHVLLQAETIAHQSVRVQLHQPLAFLHIGLSPRHIFRVPRVHQYHPDAMLFENVVQRDPIHARCPPAPSGHRIDPAGLQPFRHFVQGCRPATEFPCTGLASRSARVRPQSGSHYPRRSLRHWGERSSNRDRSPPPAAPTLCAGHGSCVHCSVARKWVQFKFMR